MCCKQRRMVAIHTGQRYLGALLGAMLLSAPVSAETVQYSVQLPETGMIEPGSTFSVLILLRNNNTNMVGYNLDVNVTGVPGEHSGNISANVALTNFFPERNLIEQDPDDMLAAFPISFIEAAPDKGVFVNAFSDSFDVVDLAIDGVSDVLAQVFFEVSADALGGFEIDLGPETSLGDENLDSIPFESIPALVTVEGPPQCEPETVGGAVYTDCDN